jgi:molybdopterin-guanine dinucleotide biosynthesis protein A
MISAALIAGGRSVRMGHDKCLVEIDGSPLWQRQLAVLSNFSAETLIIAAERPAWCPSTARWFPDRVPNSGPLAGLEAALAAASHARLLVLAVDLPGMTSAYLESLVAQATDTCGAVPVIDDLFQPLSAIYPRTSLPIVTLHLAEPDKSLQRLVRELVADGMMKCVSVSEADLPHFRNFNSPQD